MKSILVTLFIAAGAGLFFSGCNNSGFDRDPALNTMADSVGYTLGYFYGMGAKSNGLDDIEIEPFVAGMKVALEDLDAKISDEEMDALIQRFQQQLMADAEERMGREAETNIAEANEFLAENALNEDVNVTESGLQYRVIEEGTGASPTADDVVEVHYTGRLLNGEVFDSSVERGQTATFPVGQVIAGWTEGLQLMQVGGKYELFIPSELGYGNNPPGGVIQPGSLLIFEVELIGIQ